MAILAGTKVSAQIVYMCDFENPADRAQWTTNLNATANTTQAAKLVNKWYVDSLGQCGPGGDYGLYLSNDGGASLQYTPSSINWEVAYIPMQLTPGNYRLHFDWKAMGVGLDDGIYVVWLPATQTTMSAHGSGTAVPNWAKDVDPATQQVRNHFVGSSVWHLESYDFTVTAQNANGKLLILWYNSANAKAAMISAAVDNLELHKLPNTCVAPTNIRYASLTGTVSWMGNASTYDLRIVNTFSGEITNEYGLDTNSYEINTTTEGYYNFYVRAVCDETHKSDWAEAGTFVYFSGNRCIDYMDLDAARCYTGSSTNPATAQRKVDFGYQSVQSHHTVHYLPGETDPRTLNALKTIPDGEIASVRIGNWDANSPNGEAIEYMLNVPNGESQILELKYAVVMELPNHGGTADPHFSLNIYDNATGQQLSPSQCFSADFAATTQTLDPAVWTNAGSSQSSTGTDIIWHDWTTISVSLRDYQGSTLRIRVSTLDCEYDYHFAYGYFTLGCKSGDLEGMACGDTGTDHFTAPEGFKYKWYRDDDPRQTRIPGTTDTTRIFHIDPLDTVVYRVLLTPSFGSTCGYSLVANPNPRFPRPQAKLVAKPRDCRNLLDLTNTSHVAYRNRYTNEWMAQIDSTSLDVVTIDFGDGSDVIETLDKQFQHEYPRTGGTYTIRMSASMSGGVCTADTSYTVTFPNLEDSETFATVYVCGEGATYTDRKGVSHTENFNDTVRYYNMYGCNVDSIYRVLFVSEFRDTIADTICYNEFATFHGQTYNEPGYYDFDTISMYGCDSIITLNLYVEPKIEFNLLGTPYVCSGEPLLTIPYEVNGAVTRITVHPDSAAMASGFDETYVFEGAEPLVIPMPDKDLLPGVFTFAIEVDGRFGCTLPLIFTPVDVRYSLRVVEQRYGFITVTNPDYNGGFEFVAYQWYRDGILMLGETQSYILTDMDDDAGHVYTCVVLRPDGVVATTCPICYGYTPVEQVEVISDFFCYPAHVSPSQLVSVTSNKELVVYDALGNLVETVPASDAAPNTFYAPHACGLYIIVSKDGKDNAKLLVQ